MKEKIESDISRKEILTSLKGMKNKSPGSDEFFQILLVRFMQIY